jgi:hypothetical protein
MVDGEVAALELLCLGLMPGGSGATPPASCVLGQQWYDTDATAGERLLCCDPVDTWALCLAGGGGAVPALLHVRHQVTSGTNGGASSAATWNVRPLNTSVSSGIAGASLAANRVTLPAGTYRIKAVAVAYYVNRNQLRLRNITSGTTALNGVGMVAANVGAIGTTSLATLQGQLVLSVTTDLELQHYTELAKTDNGLGVPTSSGEVEVYAELWIEEE